MTVGIGSPSMKHEWNGGTLTRLSRCVNLRREWKHVARPLSSIAPMRVISFSRVRGARSKFRDCT